MFMAAVSGAGIGRGLETGCLRLTAGERTRPRADMSTCGHIGFTEPFRVFAGLRAAEPLMPCQAAKAWAKVTVFRRAGEPRTADVRQTNRGLQSMELPEGTK